jgi:hypothetical protein
MKRDGARREDARASRGERIRENRRGRAGSARRQAPTGRRVDRVPTRLLSPFGRPSRHRFLAIGRPARQWRPRPILSERTAPDFALQRFTSAWRTCRAGLGLPSPDNRQAKACPTFKPQCATRSWTAVELIYVEPTEITCGAIATAFPPFIGVSRGAARRNCAGLVAAPRRPRFNMSAGLRMARDERRSTSFWTQVARPRRAKMANPHFPLFIGTNRGGCRSRFYQGSVLGFIASAWPLSRGRSAPVGSHRQIVFATQRLRLSTHVVCPGS